MEDDESDCRKDDEDDDGSMTSVGSSNSTGSIDSNKSSSTEITADEEGSDTSFTHSNHRVNNNGTRAKEVNDKESPNDKEEAHLHAILDMIDASQPNLIIDTSGSTGHSSSGSQLGQELTDATLSGVIAQPINTIGFFSGNNSSILHSGSVSHPQVQEQMESLSTIVVASTESNDSVALSTMVPSIILSASAAAPIMTVPMAPLSTTLSALLENASFDLSNISDTVPLEESTLDIVVRVLDVWFDGNHKDKAAITSLLHASAPDVKTALVSFLGASETKEKRTVHRTLAKSIGDTAFLFYCVTPSKLDQRTALVAHIRSLPEWKQETEDVVIRREIEIARKGRKFTNVSICSLESLVYGILTAWALCMDNNDARHVQYRADAEEIFEKIQNKKKKKIANPKYYRWQMLWKNMYGRLDECAKHCIGLLEERINILDHSVIPRENVHQSQLESPSTETATAGGVSEVDCLPLTQSNDSSSPTCPEVHIEGEEPNHNGVVDVSSTKVDRKRSVEFVELSNAPSKRIRKEYKIGMDTHKPMIVYPTKSERRNDKYMNARLVFFPLHLEALISNPQQELFDFKKFGLLPHHLTLIIGIDTNLIIETVLKLREHPLFLNIKSFTYLVPSVIDLDGLYDDEDSETDSSQAECDQQQGRELLLREFLMSVLNWKYAVNFPIEYTGGDRRTVTVLTKDRSTIPNERECLEREKVYEGVVRAMTMSKCFDISGGSHSASKDFFIKIPEYMNLKVGDIVWDIGVGNPTLAFFFSVLTGEPVVGTDICPDVIACYEGMFEGLVAILKEKKGKNKEKKRKEQRVVSGSSQEQEDEDTLRDTDTDE